MERSGDWMDQARSDLEHARHDFEAEFYGQRMQDHG
jgi:HEPN domain-containing protein